MRMRMMIGDKGKETATKKEKEEEETHTWSRKVLGISE